jgi:hypothetical protein
MAYLGFGPTELIIILVVLFILLGHRLPGIMRALGRGVVNFRMDEIYEQRRWRRMPSLSTLDLWVIGGGILLMLAILTMAAGQALLLR